MIVSFIRSSAKQKYSSNMSKIIKNIYNVSTSYTYYDSFFFIY